MSISKEQQSVLAIIIGLLIAGWLMNNYWLFIAAGVVAICFPFAVLNRPVHKFWMFLSETLGWVSRHIILFVLFFFFLTPISFFRKLFGGRTLMIHQKGATSAFTERSHIYSEKDFKNPW